MSHAACPTLETLSAFALGELPEPELSAVVEHLERAAPRAKSRRAGSMGRPIRSYPS